MELSEFIKETLTQIAVGVSRSQEAVRESGGYVNPRAYRDVKATDTSHFASTVDGANVFLVDFDVAVTVSEDSATDAKAKLSVASFITLGVGGASGSASSATNRITFKVPLALPIDPVADERHKQVLQARHEEAQKNGRRVTNRL